MDLGITLGNAFANCYILMYTLFVPGFVSLALALSPTLWNPGAWTLWWDIIMMGMGQVPGVLDFTIIFGENDRCMNCTQVITAISDPDAVASVSGLYGPGAYLAWLFTAWVVAVSSIRHAKCALDNPARLEIDPELIGVIAYPLIACMDIIVRLFRCRIDPSLTAAVSVLVAALSIFSPIKRLSIQSEGGKVNVFGDDEDAEDSMFDNFFLNKRLLMLRVPRWLGYGILLSLIDQPYSGLADMWTLFSLLFVVLLYAGVVVEKKWVRGGKKEDTHKYVRGRNVMIFRPWWERAGFFVLMQGVFYTVRLTTGAKSFWPVTGSSIWDLDQITTLMLAIVAMGVSRRETLTSLPKKLNQLWKREEKEEERGLLAGRSSEHSDDRGVERIDAHEIGGTSGIALSVLPTNRNQTGRRYRVGKDEEEGEVLRLELTSTSSAV